MLTSKEHVHVPPSFGIKTFYVAQKFMLWCLQNTIKNFNFIISSVIWMKVGMLIEVNFETSNPFSHVKWCCGSQDIPFFILHAMGKLHELSMSHCPQPLICQGAVSMPCLFFL